MIRNNLLYKILGSVIVLFAFSCDDYLDKNPTTEMSNETYWTSEEEVEYALTGCYSRLYETDFFGYKRVDLDALTDNAQHKYNDEQNGYILNISRGDISKETGGLIDFEWESSYTGISSCNNFLDNVDQVDMDEDDLNEYKGEVYFLRAFFYFELVHFFGDVIIYEHVLEDDEDAKIAQSDKSEVLELIHSDLDSAIKYLPDDEYSDGHAVKGSALGLDARVLMYEDNYEEAVAITQQIIQSGIFSLCDDYQAMFVEDQTSNNEIMFSTRYLSSELYSDMDIELGLWGTVMPRQELADEYECTDGLSIDESTLYDSDNPYANRDPRMDMTLLLPDEVWYDADSNAWEDCDPSYTPFLMEKYVNKDNLPISSSTKSDQDFIHLRYADILLMFAEAENEVTGATDSVYWAINSIRGRAGVDMPELETGLSQDDMRTAIRHERRVELALEGLRYYDLKRWGIAHEIMPEVKDVAGGTIVFENPKHYLWPYQQSELDNNPNLVPNEDYE